MGRTLEVAVAAAKMAGAQLRAELHRAGGPRGADATAEVDVEVERAIRSQLLQAFPEDGFQGEETAPEAPRARAFWCVDPNDGTRTFLRGERGFAVSIARIVDGRPVLGVVYAPCFPDDDGDLLAWEEGSPLLRNGAPIARARFPGDAIVAMPRGSERAARGALEAIAPARFRPVACTAYRVALVAAGDVDGAIALRRPRSWDIAGAHALLRGAGLDLDVSYAPFEAPKRLVVGEVNLVRRPLDFLRAMRFDPPSTEVPFLVPRTAERGASIGDPGALARAQGTLVGLVAGDNLGQRVEFLSAAEIAARHPEGVRDLVDGGTWNLMAGQPTDDGELALLLARAIDHDGAPVHETIVSAYRAWLPNAFDVGGTIGRALRGAPDTTSQANGSLMRIAPLGVFAHALAPDRVAALARQESARTHAHPIPSDACAVFCVAIAHAIAHGGTPREVFEAARAWAEGRVDPVVLEDLAAAERAPPEDFERHQGWVRIAFRNAFYRLLHAPSLEEGVIDTVHAGGDTDTNAAIAGALLGAVFGRAAVPTRWQRLVLSCRPIAGLARTRHPRPRAYWPTDALVLAERLLIAGRRWAAERPR